jgi:hypothetical protein
VPLRIIDKALAFPTSSGAKGLQPRSLEVFDDLEIVNEVVGTELVGFSQDGDTVLATLASTDGASSGSQPVTWWV